jgi:hypothetical protein
MGPGGGASGRWFPALVSACGVVEFTVVAVVVVVVVVVVYF